MADASASWALSLQDQVSPSAGSAADALQKLKSKLDEDTAALSRMQAAMRQMQQGTIVNVEAFKKLRAEIAAKKAAIGDMTAAYVRMGGDFKKVAPQVDQTTTGFKAFGDAVNATGSPVGGMLGRVQGLAKALAPGGLAVGAALATVAIVAFAAAVVAAAAKLTSMVIAASDAARSQRLLLEALTGSAAGADQLGGAISRVSANVAIGSDEVSGYARQLYQAGLRGSQLEAALEAASISAATLGGDAASAFIEQAKQARNTAGAVEKLASDIKGKLGGVAERQLLSLDVQAKKLKESIKGIFASAAIEPFLRAVRTITAMFDESAATGAALRAVVSAIFDPFFKSTEKGAPVVKALIQGIVITVLQLTIVFLKIRNAIRDAFGGESKSSIDWANVAFTVGRTLAIGLAVAIGTVVAIVGALAGVWAMGVGIATAYWTGVTMAIGFAIDAIKFVWNTFVGFVDWVSSLDFGQLASDIISGLVGGLKNGASLVGDALKGVATGALNKFKSVFGIASPSKVMAEFGGFIGEGAAIGIEASAPEVEGAMSDLVSIPTQADVPVEGEGGGTSIANSSSSNVVTININAAGGDAEGIAEAVKRALAEVLEGAAITMGASVAEPT